MYKLFFPLFTFSILIFNLSCKDSTGSDTTQGTFPEPGAQLTEKQAENLVFRWEESAQEKRAPLSKQTFRLYQLESVEQRNKKTYYQFRLEQENELKTERAVGIQHAMERRQASEQVYAWQVFGEDSKGNNITLQELSPFAIGDISGSDAASLFIPTEPFSSYCYDTLYNADCTILDIIEFDCGYNIHIVTLDDADFLSNNLEFRSHDSHPAEPCIEAGASSLNIFTRFSVHVPYDKLDVVDTSEIKVMVFKEDELLPDGSATQVISINDTIKTDVIVVPKNYLTYCKVDTIICKALVNAWVEFPLEYAGDVPLPYNFVFYLVTQADHITIDDVSQSINGQQARINPNIHSHKFSGCTDYTDDQLEYYTCLDGNTGEHISKHVVVIPIPFCPDPDI